MQGPNFSNCKLAARFFTKQPANSTLFCRLNLAPKPNLSMAPSQNASMLWSTCSHCPGHSSSGDFSNCFNDSSEPAGFLPQTRTDKQQQQIEQAGGNADHKAHTCYRTADNSHQRAHYRIQVGTTLNPPAATSNLTHYWLASKLMTTFRSSPISSLVPECNLPQGQQLVLAKTGSLVPALPYAKPVPMATPRNTTRFPTICCWL